MEEKSFIELKQVELNKWKRELEQDTLVTDDNIIDKVKRVPHLYQKYLSIYVKETMTLKKMKSDLDEFYGLAFKKLLEGDRKLNKGEIDQFISCNPEYVKMNREYMFMEQVCIFLEKSVDNVKSMSYSCKAYVDLKIWLGGGK